MSALLHFDDLHVGDYWQSPERIITETDVAEFASLTGDHDPLHTDVDYAQQTPYRRPIAHGLLGLSLAAGLGTEHPNVRTDAFVSVHEWRFLRPVFFGDTVRAVAEVIEKDGRTRRRGRVIWKRSLVNQDGDIVQEGVFETLVAVARPSSDFRAPTRNNRNAPVTAAQNLPVK